MMYSLDVATGFVMLVELRPRPVRRAKAMTSATRLEQALDARLHLVRRLGERHVPGGSSTLSLNRALVERRQKVAGRGPN